jgi:hypothetical protein
MVRPPSLRRRFITRRTRSAIPAVTTIAAVTEAAAVATVAEAAAAAFVALAIAIHFPHHRGRAFFQFLDPHREVAHDIFTQTLLALDLIDRGGRGIEIEHGEMRLAVLAQAIGE